MLILLIGLPGSGKSTVGQALAKKLHYTYLNMDEKVLKRTGFATIKDVYEHRKSLWKEYEMIISKELSVQDNVVIACTGGIVENAINFLYYKENAQNGHVIVHLHADFEILADRISHHHLKEDSVDFKKIVSHVKELHRYRNSLFTYYAHLAIDTGVTEVKESVKTIQQFLLHNKTNHISK